jgi:hypothetical protein
MGQQPEHGADFDDKSLKYAQRCRKEHTWLWIVDSRQFLEYAPQLSWRVKERHGLLMDIGLGLARLPCQILARSTKRCAFSTHIS